MKLYHSSGIVSQSRSFVFPGGEVQLSFDDLPIENGDLTLEVNLQSPHDLIELILATEIIERMNKKGIRRLRIPYLPYGRQDRVMKREEAFSLRAIAKVINSLGYDEITTYDCHSDVTPALINNLTHITQLDIVKRFLALSLPIADEAFEVVVAPDAGAAKKAFGIAQFLSKPLVTATKIRNLSDGSITATQLHMPELVKGKSVCIFDDICDGGRTFIELAKILREAGATRVWLYVTHGIFSQGLDVFQGLIDGIYTTDSFKQSTFTSSLPLTICELTRTKNEN